MASKAIGVRLRPALKSARGDFRRNRRTDRCHDPGSAPHILYLRDQVPATYERTYKFLEPRDWINLRLTGRFATSFDAVTLLWAADTRNVNAVRYDDRLLRMAGLERNKLPDLVPAATILAGRRRPPGPARLCPPR